MADTLANNSEALEGMISVTSDKIIQNMLNLSSRNYTEAPLIRCSFSPETDSFVINFLIPSNIVRGFIKEIDSVQFPYLGYRWKLRFQRTKMHIGAFLFLIISKPATNMEIYLDMSLTILNREHFSKNQHYADRQVVFCQDIPRHGCKTLIELSDLFGGKFLADDYTFLLELELSNPKVNIYAQLTSTSELIHFLCNTYVDCYNADDSDHDPILFESKALNAGGETCQLGIAMSHASVFGTEQKENSQVSMYIFRRRSKNQRPKQNLSFMEFSCEIDSHSSHRRMQFFIDPETGMSCMKNLGKLEADAVTDFVRGEIADHIAKKVPFKYFNPVLEIKLNSLRTRKLIPRKLILLSPQSNLYFSTLPFDPLNTRWKIFAFQYGRSLSCGLQFESDVKKKSLNENSIDILWWSVHLGNGSIENDNMLHDGAKVALSIATRFHQMYGTEVSVDSLNSVARPVDENFFAEALSPSQCLVHYPEDNMNASTVSELIFTAESEMYLSYLIKIIAVLNLFKV